MTDLFKPVVDDTPQFDPNKNYLEELVGDGKKFKSVEDLAKGKAIADNYVTILEKKADEMRKQLEDMEVERRAGATLQELIDQAKNSNNNLQVPNNPNGNEVNNQPGLKIEDGECLFEQRFTQREREKQEAMNANLVQSKLMERFGDKYPSFLTEQMETLGLNTEDVNLMAKTRPNFLIKALGLDQTPQQNDLFQAPPRSSQRNDNFAPRGSTKRTWSYYQDLKKSNPNLYNDPKTNVQMQNDYLQLGTAFEDGDFHS